MVTRLSAGDIAPLEAYRILTGTPRLWWRCCRESIREDPNWLYGPQATTVFSQLAAWSPVAVGGTRNPDVEAAAVALEVARALSVPPNGPGEDVSVNDSSAPRVSRPEAHALSEAVQRWDRSGARPSTPPGSGLVADRSLPAVDDRLRGRVEGAVGALQDLAGGPAAVLVALTVLLLACERDHGRRVVRVPVVFGRRDGATDRGSTGVLELREFPPGPAGLFPDPRTMGVVHADASFWEALSTAWTLAPTARRSRCVLWQVVLDDATSASNVDGGSLGAAFALALRVLLSYPARRGPSLAWLREAFHGLRRSIAVTGGVDGDGRLVSVGHMDDKFRAADRMHWMLVAPKDNSHEVGKAPEPDRIRFAVTLDEADRYARAWRKGRLGIVAALVALPLMTGLGIYDAAKSRAGRDQLASQLAALSGALLNRRVDLAQLFAVKAYEQKRSPQTRAALFKAVTASPRLVRNFSAGGRITKLAGSADGATAVAGTQDGQVVRWDLSSGKRTTIARLNGPVDAVVPNADGSTVAMIGGGGVQSWTLADGVQPLGMPNRQQPRTVGVSPSGRSVVLVTESRNGGLFLTHFDRPAKRSTSVELQGLDSAPNEIAVPGESEAVVFNGGYGIWKRITLPGLKEVGGSNVGFGVHNAAATLSSSGQFFTYTNRGQRIPIWTAQGTPDYGHPSLIAETRGQDPSALALSADGRRVAVADGDVIYVSATVAADKTPEPPEALVGGGPVNPWSLTFLGTAGDRLLSVSEDQLTLWDLNQRSRISEETGTIIPVSCSGCSGPRVAVQPSGRHAAIVDGNGLSLTVQNLSSPFAKPDFAREDVQPGFAFGPPLWSRDGRDITLISPQDGSAQIRRLGPGLPITSRWLTPPSELQLPDTPVAVTLSGNGKDVIEVDASATIKVRDVETGQIHRQIDGPPDMAPTASGANNLPSGYVAVDVTASHVAVAGSNTGSVVVTDIGSGRRRVILGAGVSGVAYLGKDLLVQRMADSLEVWTASGTERTQTIQGMQGLYALTTNGRDIIVEAEANGVATVIDFPSGYVLGVLALPVGPKVNSTGMAFSPDGQSLITATEANGGEAPAEEIGQLIRWNMRDAAWVRAACNSAGHDLTPSQWAQYVKAPIPSELRCLQ